MSGYNNIKRLNVNADARAGSNLAIAAARLKSSAFDPLTDLINKYQDQESDNAEAEQKAKTYAYVDQIRSSKLPEQDLGDRLMNAIARSGAVRPTAFDRVLENRRGVRSVPVAPVAPVEEDAGSSADASLIAKQEIIDKRQRATDLKLLEKRNYDMTRAFVKKNPKLKKKTMRSFKDWRKGVRSDPDISISELSDLSFDGNKAVALKHIPEIPEGFPKDTIMNDDGTLTLADGRMIRKIQESDHEKA